MGKDNINETNKCLNTVKYIAKTVICSAVALALWAGVIALVKCLNLEITDQNIILSFIGILATFIVISNYEQVQSIEKKTQKQVDDLKEEMESTVSKIKNANKKINRYLYEMIKSSDVKCDIVARKIMNRDFSDLYYIGDQGLKELTEEKYNECLKTNPDFSILYGKNGSKGFFYLNRIEILIELIRINASESHQE